MIHNITQLKVIAFTHKNVEVNDLKLFFIEKEKVEQRISSLKESMNLNGIVYLGTCNRIEFIFTSSEKITSSFLQRFFSLACNTPNGCDTLFALSHATIYEGEKALRHLYEVAASIDSMVVGEREIITQVRTAYDACRKYKLTDDLLRLVFDDVIATAKKIYTETQIADKPVSVASIAVRKLMSYSHDTNKKIILIGAGETMKLLARYLSKKNFTHYTIYNRTVSNAKVVSDILKNENTTVEVKPLSDLKNHSEHFDIMITCTNASQAIVTPELFKQITSTNSSNKVLINLAMPSDIDKGVIELPGIKYIGLDVLTKESARHLEERKVQCVQATHIIDEKAASFKYILRQRNAELKMSSVFEKIQAVKKLALDNVFSNEIEQLDERDKALIHDIMNYMEKKCIGIPMSVLRSIALERE